MNQLLYFFNPEHDLALANNDPNFVPPQSALTLARDLETLPVWYAKPGSKVLCRNTHTEWLTGMQSLFPDLQHIDTVGTESSFSFSAAEPWGWDPAVLKQLASINSQSNPDLLVAKEKLLKIRELSHRRTAVLALKYLNSIGISATPALAVEIKSEKELDLFLKNNKSVVFKAPWSGSGKGLSWARHNPTESHKGWCRRIIQKQGSVMAEQIYEVKQNFAMLFCMEKGICRFGGYSLFETEKGIYRRNILLSNHDTEQYLINSGIPADLLLNVKLGLLQFCQTNIAPFYEGVTGIDMFVYSENGITKLHPCVEINLRTTMGYVARIFTDRFLHSLSSGTFSVDHSDTENGLWLQHLQDTETYPLVIENQKLRSGYLSLTDIQPNSQYRVSVFIH